MMTDTEYSWLKVYFIHTTREGDVTSSKEFRASGPRGRIIAKIQNNVLEIIDGSIHYTFPANTTRTEGCLFREI